jgi:hypothetical protein
MLDGTDFQPDCHAKIENKLDFLPFCGSIVKTDLFQKVIVLYYNVGSGYTTNDSGLNRNAVFTKEAVKIAYNSPPNYFGTNTKYTVNIYASDGRLLKSIPFEDPLEYRIANTEDFEQGIIIGNQVDAFLTIPFINSTASVDIINVQTGESMGRVDLTEDIRKFCEGKEDIECIDPNRRSWSSSEDFEIADHLAGRSSILAGESTNTSDSKARSTAILISIVVVLAVVILTYFLFEMRNKSRK